MFVNSSSRRPANLRLRTPHAFDECIDFVRIDSQPFPWAVSEREENFPPIEGLYKVAFARLQIPFDFESRLFTAETLVPANFGLKVRF